MSPRHHSLPCGGGFPYYAGYFKGECNKDCTLILTELESYRFLWQQKESKLQNILGCTWEIRDFPQDRYEHKTIDKATFFAKKCSCCDNFGKQACLGVHCAYKVRAEEWSTEMAALSYSMLHAINSYFDFISFLLTSFNIACNYAMW